MVRAHFCSIEDQSYVRLAQRAVSETCVFTTRDPLIQPSAAYLQGTLLQATRLLQSPSRNKSALSWGTDAPHGMNQARSTPLPPTRRGALLPAYLSLCAFGLFPNTSLPSCTVRADNLLCAHARSSPRTQHRHLALDRPCQGCMQQLRATQAWTKPSAGPHQTPVPPVPTVSVKITHFKRGIEVALHASWIAQPYKASCTLARRRSWRPSSADDVPVPIKEEA